MLLLKLTVIAVIGSLVLLLFINSSLINESNGIRSPTPVYRFYAVSYGRLGNQLFNLASTYGLARTYKRLLVLPPDFVANIKNFLNMTHLSHMDYETVFAPDTVALQHFKWGIYDEKMDVSNDEDLILGWNLQSFKYFQPYTQDMMNMMVIRDDLVHEAQDFLHTIECSITSNCTFIALHVRRGDIVAKKKYEYGHVTAPSQYIKSAMMYYLTKYTNVHFIVCSDSIEWCKKDEPHLQTGGLTTTIKYSVDFSPSTSAEFDLALLAQCNHTIITVGTYGWWAAWLAGGEAVYYNQPCRNGSDFEKKYKETDYFPPMWIGMGG